MKNSIPTAGDRDGLGCCLAWMVAAPKIKFRGWKPGNPVVRGDLAVLPGVHGFLRAGSSVGSGFALIAGGVTFFTTSVAVNIRITSNQVI